MKKFLFVFQIPETLLLINKKSKTITFQSNQTLFENLKYDENINNHDIKFRPGKNQFLDIMFSTLNKDIDLAIWTCLNQDLALPLCKNFFGRHFRSLLFLKSTNRQQYEGLAGKKKYNAIPIRKQLQLIYNQFPQYNQSNTLMLSPYQNQLKQYKNNDILVPRYAPSSLGSSFEYDIGLIGVSKYLRGVIKLAEDRQISDIRTITHMKSIQTLFKKVQNHIYKQRDYL